MASRGEKTGATLLISDKIGFKIKKNNERKINIYNDKEDNTTRHNTFP